MFKHTGHENEGNYQERQNVFMFKQILPTCIMHIKDVKSSEENVHIDVGLEGLGSFLIRSIRECCLPDISLFFDIDVDIMTSHRRITL